MDIEVYLRGGRVEMVRFCAELSINQTLRELNDMYGKDNVLYYLNMLDGEEFEGGTDRCN